MDYYIDVIMRFNNDSLIPEYQELTQKVKKYDCVIFTQLAMAHMRISEYLIKRINTRGNRLCIINIVQNVEVN